MSWHADAALLEAYAHGRIDDARAGSVEAHALACAACRGGLAAWVPRGPLDRSWARVEPQLEPWNVGIIESLLQKLGIPDHVARLLAATPSLRLSWFGAMAAALSFAVMAGRSGEGGLLVFLLVAPLVPLAGVAVAYGPGLDPTYEIGLAAPMRSYRLMLIRSMAVLAASEVLAFGASLALPLGWATAAWLLPSLGLSAASLALSTFWPPLRAGLAVAGGWLAVVLGTEVASTAPLAAFRGGGQVAFLLLILLSVFIVAGRREVLDRDPYH
jgi:hypothetical protein